MKGEIKLKHSKIKEHERNGSELIPPFLKGKMGEIIQLHSWSRERVPEYLWIGILRNSCKDKKEYFNKMYFLKEYLLNNYEEPVEKFSKILKMSIEDKKPIFLEIKKIFGEHVLDPLNVVSYFDKELRDCFYDKSKNNDDRISLIKDVVDKMYERYSEFAMDVRYIVIILRQKKIHFLEEMKDSIMIEALQKYPFLEYDDPMMEIYTCSLSSFEGMDFAMGDSYDYSKYFYEEMYLMTDCNPIILTFEENVDYDNLKDKLMELRTLLIKSNEIKYDDKKDVIIGNITYVYKIINEIMVNNLGNTIISRLALRTITEIYVNLKFLCLKSKSEPKIWESFKDYGSGKYKIIYKRIEEGISTATDCMHFNNDILKMLSNEAKSEEFIKVSFSNFANKKVRQKFIDVDEKDLYDTYYDYDTCFSHGYWGAIRESSLLLCDNSVHNYHSVSDVECQQKLICCYTDMCFLLNKIIKIMNDELGVE